MSWGMDDWKDAVTGGGGNSSGSATDDIPFNDQENPLWNKLMEQKHNFQEKLKEGKITQPFEYIQEQQEKIEDEYGFDPQPEVPADGGDNGSSDNSGSGGGGIPLLNTGSPLQLPMAEFTPDEWINSGPTPGEVADDINETVQNNSLLADILLPETNSETPPTSGSGSPGIGLVTKIGIFGIAALSLPKILEIIKSMVKK